jgi:2-oxo-4-hydroxy-4-carboxy-5-ureidoimidazoline decarboxylase
MSVTLAELNAMDQAEFTKTVGHVFEHSSWIAEGAWIGRPFPSVSALHAAMRAILSKSSPEKQLGLIQAHPDLVGKAVLTAESQGEQAGAGLTDLTPDEVEIFDRYNKAYREKFGFPFVICVRENKKDAILTQFPLRMEHTIEQEHFTALVEICKIARLRLEDAVAG